MIVVAGRSKRPSSSSQLDAATNGKCEDARNARGMSDERLRSSGNRLTRSPAPDGARMITCAPHDHLRMITAHDHPRGDHWGQRDDHWGQSGDGKRGGGRGRYPRA